MGIFIKEGKAEDYKSSKKGGGGIIKKEF